MGGSLARDLAAAGWRVQGADRDDVAVAAARSAGVIEGGIELERLDLLVLAVPVSAVSGWIRQVADSLPPGAVATDLASTKRTIVEAAETAGIGDRFVGAHPMAGDHRSGWAAARTGLFRDAAVWICPADTATAESVDRVEEIWRTLGGRPRRTDAATHDRTVAWVSHLPQLTATALGAALATAGIHAPDLGPGGRDTTRLAASDPEIWSDILQDNADELVPAIEGMIEELVRMRQAIHGGDGAAVRALLQAARSWRETTPRPSPSSEG